MDEVGVFYASSFLSDTTIANPTIKSGFDTLDFRLSVVDDNDVSGVDSVILIASTFVYCLGECRENIHLGDSVQLNHCISGGITPYSYSWSPEDSLSDSTIRNPWAKPTNTTSYELTIIDSAGCIATSNCEVQVIQTGISPEPITTHPIRIFPNPLNSENYLTIEINSPENQLLTIYNANGTIQFEVILTEKHTVIELSPLKSGVYLFKTMSKGKITDTGKLVIN